jgi:anaerobic magnesium-protoporphyrin IX monomethyl ester cyclase
MILLINPPFYRFLNLNQDYVPLSLLAVGSKMAETEDVKIKNMEVGGDHYAGYSERSSNYDIYIESLNNPEHEVWQELRRTIQEFKPDKIGINVLNVKYQSALKVIDIAKEYRIPVIVGGNHPTTEPEVYPSDIEVFCGEYESNGRLKDLDDTSFPNFDILLDKYSPNGYAHILTSRGCPFSCNHCTFCASHVMWGCKVTYKSIDRILQEMWYINDRFKSDYFTFWDETFTINKKRITEFCSKYDIPAMWRCDTRADSITDEMVRMMKSSGCGQMSLGLESGDNMILDYIKKGETTDDFMRAADILNENFIQWKAYMIIGFPKDTEETILKSIEFVKSLRPFRITLSFFTPYRGTDLYEETKSLGLITDNYDMSLFSHQSPHNYFCPLIPKEKYFELRNLVSLDIDNYNKEALKSWT